MRKLLIFLMMIIGLSSKAQNFIGQSLKDIKTELDFKGYILDEGYTVNGIYYLSGYDREEVKIYYFSSDNRCIGYKFAVKEATYQDVERALYNEGYILDKSTNSFRSDKFIAKIKWEDSIKTWSVLFTPRLDE